MAFIDRAYDKKGKDRRREMKRSYLSAMMCCQQCFERVQHGRQPKGDRGKNPRRK